MHADFRSFAEIVFQNWEDTVQSWHIDDYSFFVVGSNTSTDLDNFAEFGGLTSPVSALNPSLMILMELSGFNNRDDGTEPDNTLFNRDIT
ncbi:hypothetical protein LXL04_022914 [Taraxacum kok-saghyz]